jgi:hypothetical protein
MKQIVRRWAVLLFIAALALSVVGYSAQARVSRSSTATAAKHKKCGKKGKKKCKSGKSGPQAQSAALVGTWLGPAPNATASCPGTVLYTFDSAGNWSGDLVYQESPICVGGNFTVGGTYSFDGRNLTLHFTRCPESCPGDATVTISFIDSNDFTMSGVDGVYHRQ